MGELLRPVMWWEEDASPHPSPPTAVGRMGPVPHLHTTVELTL